MIKLTFLAIVCSLLTLVAVSANEKNSGANESKHKFKLTYFDGWSRGEAIRWCFAYAGQEYEDNRISLLLWPFIKNNGEFPFSQVPILVVDGNVTIAQQRAIARYIAKMHGFYGEDLLSQALVDTYVDGVADLQSALDKPARTIIPWNKKPNYIEFRDNSLKPFLERYTGFLAKSGTGLLVGNKITLADLFVAEILDRIVQLYDIDALSGHQTLRDLVVKVKTVPSIAQHCATRQQNPFA